MGTESASLSGEVVKSVICFFFRFLSTGAKDARSDAVMAFRLRVDVEGWDGGEGESANSCFRDREEEDELLLLEEELLEVEMLEATGFGGSACPSEALSSPAPSPSSPLSSSPSLEVSEESSESEDDAAAATAGFPPLLEGGGASGPPASGA